MKKKIYSKLFQFCDPKSWYKDNGHLVSTFYKEYKLDFEKKNYTWICKISPSSNHNGSYYSPTYIRTVTFNKTGKIFASISTFIFLMILHVLILDKETYFYLYPCYVIFSVIFPFLMFSIFNWKIYMAFRIASYQIKNKDKIEEKERLKKLNSQIVEIVNNTLAKNPKYARKTKLNKLKNIFK